MKPNILVVGKGRSGKDEACEILCELTDWVNAGTFSKYLTPFVAKELGFSEEFVYETRHQHRDEWFRIGNQVRKDDPTALAKLAFKHGNVSGGVRGLEEIKAIRASGIADLIIWIERDVPDDPTLEFDSYYADTIIENNGSLEEFRRKLRALTYLYTLHQ